MSMLKAQGRIWLVPDDQSESVVFDVANLNWHWSQPADYSDKFLQYSEHSDVVRDFGTASGDEWSVTFELGRSADRIQPVIGISADGCMVTRMSIVFRKDEK